MSSDKNKQLVIRFFEAFSSNDFAATMAFLDDDDFQWWIPGSPDTFALAGARDKAAFGELLKAATSKCKDGIKINVLEIIAEGSRLAVEAESYAELDGKIYNNFYHFVIVLKNGKLIRVKEYMDTIHANDLLCN